MTKTMTLIPAGGLANRIYAIASAIGFCRDNNMRLKIIWFKDWGMGADFHHILTLDSTIKDVQIIDSRLYHFLNNKPRLGNLRLPAIYQHFAFGTAINEFKTNPATTQHNLRQAIRTHRRIHLISYTLFYEWPEMFSILKPLPAIQKQIDQQIATFAAQPTVGIHIRRTDHQKAITKSPTELFIQQIKQEIAIQPETLFYLATDSEQEKQILVQHFGNKIITSPQKANRNSESGIINALVELHTLASTGKIYGSSDSTFSALAAKIGKIPLYVVLH